MKVVVKIKVSKRVRMNNRECYGLTVTGRNKASIYISKAAYDDIGQYAITLFHELMHLWIIMIKSSGADINVRRSHKFIGAIVDELPRTVKILKSKGRQYETN